MLIEYITNEGGDWVVLKVDNKEYYSGHSIPDFEWLSLLKTFNNVSVWTSEISDEDMEGGNY